jgi:alpha-beta hydrolase superfamily lysophospholipase
MPRPPPSLAPLLRRTLAGLGVLLATVTLAWGVALGAVYLRQEGLLFHPEPLAQEAPLARGRPGDAQWVEEVRIPVPGAELHALHVRHPAPRGLVFFLHGNAGNVATWSTNLAYYQRVNYDLFLLDYRGYGKSSGQIDSEAQLHADVRAAWDAVAPAYAGRPRVVYGRSLGTGLAVHLAREVAPDLLVLVSPYVSVLELARRDYPVVADWVLKYPLASDAVIGTVRSPILIAHGGADTLIPVDHAHRLARLAGGPTQLLEVPGAGHDDIHRFPAYLDGLAARLAELPAPAGGGGARSP